MRYSLWQLLSVRGIEIPVFQRDYAQGRPDKATLRYDFLHQLEGALSNKKDADGNLDFVYSFGDDNREAKPLDGQQRLTTLWLLHWFLAVKSLEGEELDRVLSVLSRFSYRTRHSSTDFIASLCKKRNIEKLKFSIDFADDIRDSTWFVKSWIQDPTVMGMLITIKGNKVANINADSSNKNSSSIALSFPNGIQPIFEKYCREELKKFWNSLTGDNCPITFDHLMIQDIEVKSPDLLYVKMNARGKPLSEYEKFKAQWIKAIKNDNKEESFVISRLIDNQWSDIFWTPNLTEGIDERKMAFFTRFYLYRLLDTLITDESFKAITLEKQDRILYGSPLYGKEVDNGTYYCCEFKGLDEFCLSMNESDSFTLITCEANEQLKTIFERVKQFSDVLVNPYYPDFSFIPKLRGHDNGSYVVRKLLMKEQAFFFSICLYLVESAMPGKEALSRWLRVCANIIENTNSESNRQTHLNVIRRISELGRQVLPNKVKGCDAIYDCLCANKYDRSSTDLEKVLWEEREKAEQILSDGGINEEDIKTAEKFAFFNGAIRFLFLNENGDIDWTNFKTKFSTAQQVFCPEGLNESENIDDKINRNLISHCDIWMQQIETDKYNLLSKKVEAWHKILLSTNFYTPVHKILMNIPAETNPTLKDADIYRSRAHKCLVDGTYLNLRNYNSLKAGDYYVRWIGGELPEGGMCLYLKNYPRQSFFLASSWLMRMERLFTNFNIIKPIDCLYSRSDYFDVEYRGYTFRFQKWGCIDMYADGKRLQDIEELCNKCMIETSSVVTQNSVLDTIKDEFDRCIKSYEDWIDTSQLTKTS